MRLIQEIDQTCCPPLVGSPLSETEAESFMLTADGETDFDIVKMAGGERVEGEADR